MERIHRGPLEDGLAAIGIGGALTAITFVVRRYLPAKHQLDTFLITAGGVSVTALTFAVLRSRSLSQRNQLAKRVKHICVGGG